MDEPAVRLAWTDFVYDLAELLNARDLDTPLYLVGGAVRDAYIGREITDIDIAVAGDAIGLARCLADWLDADIYVMDAERGVARLFVGAAEKTVLIDFARLRGPTLHEDLKDRDFTINAMATDLLNKPDRLIDPLGGAADLRLKVLRRCSDHAIADDPIRALRAVRLSAQFDLKIHPETAADIRRHADGLASASGERIRDEFFKLLGLDHAARALRVLQHLGLLRQILPAADGLIAAEMVAWAQTLAAVERMSALLTAISRRRTDNTAAAFDLGMLVIQFDRFRTALQAHIERSYGNGRKQGELLVLAALLHRSDVGGAGHDRGAASHEQARSVARSLKLSAEEERKLLTALKHFARVVEARVWTELELHRFWYLLGDSGIDAILLGAAQILGDRGSALKQGEWLAHIEAFTSLLDAYFNRFDELVDPKLFLNGNDVKQLLDMKSGPRIGAILGALREAQATGAVTSLAQAREFVLSHTQSRPD